MIASSASQATGGSPRSWLRAGEALSAPTALISDGGRAELVFDDGLRVLLDGESVWHLPNVRIEDEVVMQDDGNLVAYTGGVASWASGTEGFSASTLQISDEGTLVIRHHGHAVWSSDRGYIGDRLGPGGFLAPGGFLRSPNGDFTAMMQADDGNFVIYSSAGDPVWASGVAEPGALLMLDRSGDLRVFGPKDPTWSSNTAGHGGAGVELGDDGVLRLIHDGRTVWSSSAGHSDVPQPIASSETRIAASTCDS